MDIPMFDHTLSANRGRLLPAWQTYLLAFTASACSLIIELLAGRIMAPLIGVSLYTWTSIIGVVLAGISVGNFLGGKLADRFASRRLLGLLLGLSGVASLSILYTASIVAVSKGPASFPLVARIVVLTAAIFFLPSCLLGTISPLLVKLTLHDLTRSGNLVGRIYAISTAGSLVGTFATGFYLVSMFGTRAVTLGVSLCCFLLAFLFGDWSVRGRGHRVIPAVLLVAAAGGGYWLMSTGALASACLKETNYYCIKVMDQESDGEPVKALVLDHMVHSFNSLEKPEKLTYGYEFVYAALTEYAADQLSSPVSRTDASEPADTGGPRATACGKGAAQGAEAETAGGLRTLFIGGGGYTFPRYVEACYPGSTIDVIEIDPEVTRTAAELLGLNPAGAIRTINLDARLALEQMSGDQMYDLVLGDAFHGFSVPYHLTTKEFNDTLKAHLAPGGIYMLNIIDGRSGIFARSEARTLSQTFPYVAAVPIIEEYASVLRNSWVLIGALSPISRESYLAAAVLTPRPDIAAHLWDGAKLEEFLASGPSVLITDRFAPVDNLLAPVFEESGF